ncbi:hypothetical protein ACIP88_00185 [Streptomyces uncialis]|uniref:hypothetical protein n=1 Tax=Streptomyces uncialis TaxID=1048205 RepID=UPI00382E9774
MEAPRAVGPAAAAYAAALRDAVSGFTSQGGTQKEIAVAAQVAPATLSRYLSGERIAPRGFLTALDGFLAGSGRPLEPQVLAELAELCGRAHEASRSPAVQLAHLQEELARVRGEKRATEAELRALKTHAEQLTEKLRHSLEQTRRAEDGRLVLEARVDDQDQRLQDAQVYTRRLQAELTAQHDQAVLVQREVEVLRHQNHRLLGEDPATDPAGQPHADAVSAMSTQITDLDNSASPGSPADSSSTFRPPVPAPEPALGHATTRSEFSAELKKLRLRAGGRTLWPVDRLARVSRGEPWPMHDDAPREDRVLMAWWFDASAFPDNWKRLERVLRALGASPIEVGSFYTSFYRPEVRREGEQVRSARNASRPAKVAEAMRAVLVLAAVAVIGVCATAVLQADTESWVAKSLTALVALAAAAIIWAAGLFLTPTPHAPEAPHVGGPVVAMFLGGPVVLTAAVILPFITGTDAWGHWAADLIGLL